MILRSWQISSAMRRYRPTNIETTFISVRVSSGDASSFPSVAFWHKINAAMPLETSLIATIQNILTHTCRFVSAVIMVIVENRKVIITWSLWIRLKYLKYTTAYYLQIQVLKFSYFPSHRSSMQCKRTCYTVCDISALVSMTRRALPELIKHRRF